MFIGIPLTDNFGTNSNSFSHAKRTKISCGQSHSTAVYVAAIDPQGQASLTLCSFTAEWRQSVIIVTVCDQPMFFLVLSVILVLVLITVSVAFSF